MIKHIVMWELNSSYSIEEKKEIKETFKKRLEALDNIMEGIKSIEVVIDTLPSSNMDMMLVSEFKTKEVLDAYQIHPKHTEVSSFLKGKTLSRNCMDYLL